MNKNEPKSAKENQRTYQSWKFYETLTTEEIKVLIGKRKNDMKYEKDPQRIKELRTDIAILNDAYEIIKRKNLGEE